MFTTRGKVKHEDVRDVSASALTQTGPTGGGRGRGICCDWTAAYYASLAFL